MSTKNSNFMETEEILNQINSNSTSKASEYNLKNLLLNFSHLNSAHENNPQANLPDEKLFETFMMFQNFMKIMNYSSSNTNLIPTNGPVSTKNSNNEDILDVMPNLKEKIKLRGDNESIQNNQFNDPVIKEKSVVLNEAKSYVKSDSNLLFNNDVGDEKFVEQNFKDGVTKCEPSKHTNESDPPTLKNISLSAAVSQINIKNFDEIPIKTLSTNFMEILEKNLENAIYEAVEEKSLNKNNPGRQVKRIQPKKSPEFFKQIDTRR